MVLDLKSDLHPRPYPCCLSTRRGFSSPWELQHVIDGALAVAHYSLPENSHTDRLQDLDKVSYPSSVY